MSAEKIILFDGVCNLCNSSVNFIIDRDAKNIFRFASLQSEVGQKILSKFGLNGNEFDSIILISDNKYFIKSTAAINISKDLKFPWKLSVVFLIIPVFLRDYLYDILAKNRYKWFGRKDSCRISDPEIKNKFL